MGDFSIAANLLRARRALAEPPTVDWVQRPEPRGYVAAEFVVPLELTPTTNATRGAAGWRLGKLKKALFQIMWMQSGGRWKAPLSGRPQVLCVRFTSNPPDQCSDWAKHAVDMLCLPTLRASKRLGILVDDSPKHIELHQWSEPARRGEGFAYLQVRS